MQNILTLSPRVAGFSNFILASILGGVAPMMAQQPVAVSRPSGDRERGIELYKQNQFFEATEALKRAVAINKKDDEAWYFLGLSQIQKKDYKSATKSFENALKIKPGSAQAHTGMAYSYLLRNKIEEAIREALTAVRVDRTIADAYYIIGVSRLRRGEKQGALENAETAIKLRPQFGFAYWLKSQALVSFVDNVPVMRSADIAEAPEVRKARYGEAIEALEKYLQLTPNAPNRDVWTEQLESLRLFVTPASGSSEKIVSSKGVTTKARVLSKPAPAYTEEARRNQVAGTVILRCVFSADGTVKHFIVVEGLADGLTEVAIRAARKIKFVPATIEGRPVSMWMELQYNFNLY